MDGGGKGIPPWEKGQDVHKAQWYLNGITGNKSCKYIKPKSHLRSYIFFQCHHSHLVAEHVVI